MFTVGEATTPQERMVFSYTSLSAGWQFADFAFTGDLTDVNQNDRSDFKDGVFRLLFETPGLNMYLGLAGGLTGMESHNYLNIGAQLYNNFILTRSDRFWLLLPLQINTDLKRSEQDGANRSFQQSAFQVGAGLGFKSTLNETFNLQMDLIPNYGFSFSQGKFFGGSIFSLNGKARLYLENIFPERAVVLGYDFNFRSYEIDGEIYDYDFTGHTLSLGITF
ncbi:MAG: hypothetical protein WD599_01520 [Balneolaceae bacterium]